MFEHYLFLFNNKFFANLIFFPANDYALDVMLNSGLYEKHKLFIAAFLSSFCAYLVNYLLGRLLRLLENQEFMKDQKANLVQAQKYFNKYGYYILIFSFIPLWGALITCAAGVLRFKINYFIFAVLILSIATNILYIYYFFVF